MDCNLLIDARDALAVLRVVTSQADRQAGSCPQTAGLYDLADMDCDGSATVFDALLTLRIAASVAVSPTCEI